MNDFLSEVPENFTVLEVRELDAIADKFERGYEDNYRMLQTFVSHVKVDCVIDKVFFDFFSIPDLILKMKYSKKDYDIILKVLLKVKNSYLEQKMEKEVNAKMSQSLMKSLGRGQEQDGDGDIFEVPRGKKMDDDEHKISEMQITDEDFVPLDLFDGVLAEF